MYKRIFTDSRVVPAPADEIFALLDNLVARFISEDSGD